MLSYFYTNNPIWYTFKKPSLFVTTKQKHQNYTICPLHRVTIRYKINVAILSYIMARACKCSKETVPCIVLHNKDAGLTRTHTGYQLFVDNNKTNTRGWVGPVVYLIFFSFNKKRNRVFRGTDVSS